MREQRMRYMRVEFNCDFFFTKWLPAAILDDRKSLLIAFLAISDQYATFINSLSKAFPAISDQYTTFF